MNAYLIHELLERSAERIPDAVAVVDGERTITYAELDDEASRLAGLLQGCGVGRGDRVGLYLEKSLESVVGIYGVLKAGAAYVPLDPYAPTARLGYILSDCEITCLLTGIERSSQWSELREHGAMLEIIVVLNATHQDVEPVAAARTLTRDDLASAERFARPTPSIDLDLAYVLYTSGSTGVPKGVMISHANALAFVEWATDEFAVSDADVLSSHAPLHFDLSTFDLFASASAGAQVALVPHTASVFPIEIRRFIERVGVTIWYSVPSVLSLLATRGKLARGDLPRLRTVLFAGEVFPTKYLRLLMDLLPSARFANLYGPTETNVCTWYEVPPLPDEMTEPIPIGKPITNVETFAVDDGGRIVGAGKPGELWVRGRTVMQGYWRDAERTERGLVAQPVDGLGPDRAYRTGDLVELQVDGNYRFLGRRDSQIKSRGYRIELGDIESALYAHHAVEECAVVAIPDELVSNRIKAFVALRSDVGRSELTRFCSARIPKYMVPESIEVLDELPKTSTGKIDRQALARAALQTTEDE